MYGTSLTGQLIGDKRATTASQHWLKTHIDSRVHHQSDGLTPSTTSLDLNFRSNPPRPTSLTRAHQTNQGDRAMASSRSASRQEWRQTQPTETVAVSKLPNESRSLRLRDSDVEEKKGAEEGSTCVGPNVLSPGPVTTLKRGARSTGNLLAGNSLELRVSFASMQSGKRGC